MKRIFLVLTAFVLIFLSACDDNSQQLYDEGYSNGYEDCIIEIEDDIERHYNYFYDLDFTPSDAYDVLYDYVHNGSQISKEEAECIMSFLEELPYWR